MGWGRGEEGSWPYDAPFQKSLNLFPTSQCHFCPLHQRPQLPTSSTWSVPYPYLQAQFLREPTALLQEASQGIILCLWEPVPVSELPPSAPRLSQGRGPRKGVTFTENARRARWPPRHFGLITHSGPAKNVPRAPFTGEQTDARRG